jgi:hypothetical protein
MCLELQVSFSFFAIVLTYAQGAKSTALKTPHVEAQEVTLFSGMFAFFLLMNRLRVWNGNGNYGNLC